MGNKAIMLDIITTVDDNIKRYCMIEGRRPQAVFITEHTYKEIAECYGKEFWPGYETKDKKDRLLGLYVILVCREEDDMKVCR